MDLNTIRNTYSGDLSPLRGSAFFPIGSQRLRAGLTSDRAYGAEATLARRQSVLPYGKASVASEDGLARLPLTARIATDVNYFAIVL